MWTVACVGYVYLYGVELNTIVKRTSAPDYCTLADSFRGLKKRGRRCEIRHIRRVGVEYQCR